MFKTDKQTNCADVDPESFFPDSELTKENTMVLKICNTCDARTDCLEYALGWNVVGIWGGTNTRERQAIRKRKNIKPKDVILSYRGMEGLQWT
jgi:hypothetical protein